MSLRRQATISPFSEQPREDFPGTRVMDKTLIDTLSWDKASAFQAELTQCSSDMKEHLYKKKKHKKTPRNNSPKTSFKPFILRTA